MIILRSILSLLLLGYAGVCSGAPAFEPKPNDPSFEKFQPVLGPKPAGPVLKTGDRLAICGDSITEQKMYSRIMETYLTVCAPQLASSVRQYGWGGETASGFLARMTNDCLRFKPSVATTCYGMNDHGYRAYEEAIGQNYREKQTAIVEAFKANGVRVVLGSPGCVSQKPEPLNLNLCELRNIDIEIAREQNVGFADVFWPMLTAEFMAHQKYGTNYHIAGRDGVHPGWAGHLAMACAFLKGLGLTGEVGNFSFYLGANKGKVSGGHELVSVKDGEYTIKSARYPFCMRGEVSSDDSVLSGATLVPFNQELNRLLLRAQKGKGKSFKVTWGAESRTYTAQQLANGVNLAEDYPVNPFSEAFRKVDEAVAAKQRYETKQIKQVFHDFADGKYKSEADIKDKDLKELFGLRNQDGKFDMKDLEAATEKQRQALLDAIKAAFVPVTHVIKITAEE